MSVSQRPSLTLKLIAEFIGTFTLVGGVIGTALFSSANTGYLGVAIAVGLTVIAGAYAFGPVSGGHFNPAVSFGLASAGKFSWKLVLPYLVAQVLGGAAASSLLYAIAANGPHYNDLGSFASNGYGELSPEGYGLVAVILAETVLTALFVIVITGVTSKQAAPGFAGIAIGLTLTMLHLIAIPVSNASFNPARSIATAIYGGPVAIGQLWVFIVFPIVGGVIGGVIAALIFKERPAVISAANEEPVNV